MAMRPYRRRSVQTTLIGYHESVLVSSTKCSMQARPSADGLSGYSVPAGLPFSSCQPRHAGFALRQGASKLATQKRRQAAALQSATPIIVRDNRRMR
jgi:hypothetical protein